MYNEFVPKILHISKFSLEHMGPKIHRYEGAPDISTLTVAGTDI